jgi:hypothetical protein
MELCSAQQTHTSDLVPVSENKKIEGFHHFELLEQTTNFLKVLANG